MKRAAVVVLVALALSSAEVPGAQPSPVNPYGIMTMLNSGTIDTGAAAEHLRQARDLAGEWGWVRQFFKMEPGQDEKAVEFLLLCRALHLTPIVCLVDFEVDRRPDETGSFSRQAEMTREWLLSIYERGLSMPYIEVGNEPNLHWGGPWPDPISYGRLLVEVSKVIRELDPSAKIMNAALAPSDGTHELEDGVVGSLGDRNINNLTFIDLMFSFVPEVGEAIDIWASHPYSIHHPPEYRDERYSVVGYEWELAEIARFGHSYPVVITEAGYSLAHEGITEENRAEYMVRIFRDIWAKDPRVVAACPFELGDFIWGGWEGFDWVRGNGTATPQYDAVAALAKPEGSDPWNTPLGRGSIHGNVQVSPATEGIPAPSGGIIVWAQPGNYADITGAGGEFSLTGLPAGTYTLRLYRDGYTQQAPAEVDVRGKTKVELAAVYHGMLGGSHFEGPGPGGFTIEPAGRSALLPPPHGRAASGGLMVISTAHGPTEVWQHTDYCTVEQGARYAASAHVLPLAGSAQINLALQFCDNVGMPVDNGWVELPPVAAPPDEWFRLELAAQAPVGARRVKVVFVAQGKGSIMLDDITIAAQ